MKPWIIILFLIIPIWVFIIVRLGSWAWFKSKLEFLKRQNLIGGQKDGKKE